MNPKWTISILIVAVIFPISAYAQDINDFWVNDFKDRGLFTPHIDFCDSSTEVFVAIGGSNRGYCIEKNERSALHWEEAREACSGLGKRLPEFGEWSYACRNATGLNGMLDTSWEWTSNSTTPVETINGHLIVSVAGGAGTCTSGSYDTVASWNGASQQARPFRCVR